GTSMAAPEVTGAAALIWSSDPSLSAAEVRARILGGTDYIGNIGNNASKPTITNGRLDVFNSLKPDLSWTSVTAPLYVNEGNSFAMDQEYRDSGSPTGADFTITYYLSSQPGIGSDATVLGTETVDAAAGGLVGEHHGATPTFSIGQPGSYYIIAKLNSG